MSDALARIFRTIIQLLAGGLLFGLFQQLALDVPSQYSVYMPILSFLVVNISQNIAEQNGWIPAILKPVNAREETVETVNKQS